MYDPNMEFGISNCADRTIIRQSPKQWLSFYSGATSVCSGATMIVLGLMTIGMGITRRVIVENSYSPINWNMLNISAGIWCGSMFVFFGVVAIISGKCQKKPMVAIHAVFCTFSVLFAVALIVVSGMNIGLSFTENVLPNFRPYVRYYYRCPYDQRTTTDWRVLRSTTPDYWRRWNQVQSTTSDYWWRNEAKTSRPIEDKWSFVSSDINNNKQRDQSTTIDYNWWRKILSSSSSSSSSSTTTPTATTTTSIKSTPSSTAENTRSTSEVVLPNRLIDYENVDDYKDWLADYYDGSSPSIDSVETGSGDNDIDDNDDDDDDDDGSVNFFEPKEMKNVKDENKKDLMSSENNDEVEIDLRRRKRFYDDNGYYYNPNSRNNNPYNPSNEYGYDCFDEKLHVGWIVQLAMSCGMALIGIIIFILSIVSATLAFAPFCCFRKEIKQGSVYRHEPIRTIVIPKTESSSTTTIIQSSSNVNDDDDDDVPLLDNNNTDGVVLV